jgi:hypothetical protein
MLTHSLEDEGSPEPTAHEPAPQYVSTYKGEIRFEYLPEVLQERLREMALRPHDPMRLPRDQRLPILRGFIGSLLGTALLPGFIYPQAVGFFIAVASVTGVGVTFILERVAAKLPSFWYLHPSFLIGYHFGTVEVYPLVGLLSVNAYKKRLHLRFQAAGPELETLVEISCPETDAVTSLLWYYSGLAKRHLEQNNAQAITEIELFPQNIW